MRYIEITIDDLQPGDTIVNDETATSRVVVEDIGNLNHDTGLINIYVDLGTLSHDPDMPLLIEVEENDERG